MIILSLKNLDFGEFIDFSIKRRFGIITFNRENRANALTIDMLRNIKKAVKYCQTDKKVRGLILTGKGNSFTSGLDLEDIDGSDHQAVKNVEKTAGEITALLWYGKPVICAINGKAMGDGVIYTLASDYRIAVKESFFQMPEVNYGIFPGTGCVTLMPRIIGIAWTRKMLMFAEKISSEKALEICLIDQIVENQDELMKNAMKKAKFLFPKNQTVINTIKLCCNNLIDKSFTKAYELEKIGSGWYEHEDKEKFIEDFTKIFKEDRRN